MTATTTAAETRAAGRIIELSPAPGAPAERGPRMGGGEGWSDIERIDLYDLADLDLAGVTGIIISGMCDQVYLERQQAKLVACVEAGGRILVNGHVATPFLPGLPKWRKLVFTRPDDLVIEPASAHPIWEGIDMADVLYRTGVPGQHSRARLEEIGVAGFYGRGYAVRLPEGARVINTIGPLRAPVDYAFPLGAGEVVVHSGLDLEAFPDTPGTTLGRFATNVRAWLGGTA